MRMMILESNHDLTLSRTGKPMNVNKELSARLAEAVDARIGHCWRNAWVALYEPEAEGALYVEGWIINPDSSIDEHGWLELDGEIIDPTFYDPPAKFYFPGLRFDRSQARAEAPRQTNTYEPGGLPIAWRYGGGEMYNPEYRQAYEDALEFVRLEIESDD